jgi:hypothetical protein
MAGRRIRTALSFEIRGPEDIAPNFDTLKTLLARADEVIE